MLVRYVCLVLISSWLICGHAEIASGPSKSAGGDGGWLDRLVMYYKNKLVADVERAQNVKFNVTLERAPEGYVDSPEWNETSVLRLLGLVRQSEGAKPVRRAIRRAMRPLMARRFYYTPEDSRVMFPSIMKSELNFYYSDSDEHVAKGVVEYVDSYEELEAIDKSFGESKKRREKYDAIRKNVVVVRNPVEARLPSSRISIDLLRTILEERAMAARFIPTTSKVTLTWLPRQNATKKMKKKKASAATTAAADGGKDGTEPTTHGDAAGTPAPESGAEHESGSEGEVAPEEEGEPEEEAEPEEEPEGEAEK